MNSKSLHTSEVLTERMTSNTVYILYVVKIFLKYVTHTLTQRQEKAHTKNHTCTFLS